MAYILSTIHCVYRFQKTNTMSWIPRLIWLKSTDGRKITLDMNHPDFIKMVEDFSEGNGVSVLRIESV
jgi:hypothetical protein